jgi:ATP-dependent DNA helicase PIF1
VILGTDGTRAVENSLDDESPATALSFLDYYHSRPITFQYNEMTLLHFAQIYTMSQTDSEPKLRNKTVIVIVKPHYSPDPNGSNYEQYCRQKLMLHKPFRELSELTAGHASHTDAYADYLQSGNVPPCLQDDIYRLQQQEMNDEHQQTQDEITILRHNSRQVEEWMILCQQNPQIEETDPDTHVDWSAAARAYPNLSEAPTFINRNKESVTVTVPTTANPQLLQGTQLKAYQSIAQHFPQNITEPLRMIITGTAGTQVH